MSGCRILAVTVMAESTSKTISEHAKNVSMDMAGIGFRP